MRSLKIVRILGDERQNREDLITEEISLSLLAEHRRIAVLMCSPGDLEDLVRGFFYTNGFVQAADQIRRIVINRATWSAFIELAPEIDPETLRLSGVIGSACGAMLPTDGYEQTPGEEEPPDDREDSEGVEAGWQISSYRISDLMEEFRKRSEIHRQTGGVHAAALADSTGVLVFREDIGRHNAVDKVIGAHLVEESGFTDSILLTSGRLSSEIMQKAGRCRLPIVVSRSAPTDRSVALARERNITLIGFARGRRMNIYSGGQRIVVEEQ